jgi:hypothetical protein
MNFDVSPLGRAAYTQEMLIDEYWKLTGRVAQYFQNYWFTRTSPITGLLDGDHMFTQEKRSNLMHYGNPPTSEDLESRLRGKDLYGTCLSTVVAMSKQGDPKFGSETFIISSLRQFSEAKRKRSAGAQYLVYKYNMYLPLVHSKTPISYLCGVKHHPFGLVRNHTIEETEICECCPSPLKLKTIKMANLRDHLKTLKHICNKWQVSREDALEEAEILRVKLRMTGYIVGE